jgi:hypothetical protein
LVGLGGPDATAKFKELVMAQRRTSIAAALLCASTALGAGASRAEAPRPAPFHDALPGPAAKGRLGVVLLAISPELRAALGAPMEHGVLVDRVSPDSPAARAGIKVGDVIAEVDGQAVEDRRDVVSAIAKKQKDDTVAMRVIRDRQSLVIVARLDSDAEPMPGGGWFPLDPDEWRDRMEDRPGGGKLWSYRWDGRGDGPGFAFPPEREAQEQLEKRIEALERKIEALEKKLDAP